MDHYLQPPRFIMACVRRIGGTLLNVRWKYSLRLRVWYEKLLPVLWVLIDYPPTDRLEFRSRCHKNNKKITNKHSDVIPSPFFEVRKNLVPRLPKWLILWKTISYLYPQSTSRDKLNKNMRLNYFQAKTGPIISSKLVEHFRTVYEFFSLQSTM